MKMTYKRPVTWTPAVLQKTPDNLVSSKYTTAKVFVPSYEKEPPCIRRLLANDYQRIWLQEKKVWDKILATRIATKKILPRMLVKRKIPACVTVKYLTKAEREAEEKKKKLLKPYIKGKAEIEDSAYVKDCEMKLEKCKTNLEACEEAKSEISKQTKKYDEVQPQQYNKETYEKEKVGKMYEETKSEKYEETQEDEELTSYAGTRPKESKIVEVNKHEETELKERDKIQQEGESKSISIEETQSKKSEKVGEHKEMELEEYDKMQQENEEATSVYGETKSKKSEKMKMEDHKKTELAKRDITL